MNWRHDFYFYKNKHKGKYLRERRSHPTKALSLNNISLFYNEVTKKLSELIHNKFSCKEEQCVCYFC
jgi:hypothetical protein